jgi:hypothetical protein
MALSSWYAFDVVAALTLDADYVIGRHARASDATHLTSRANG